MVNVKTLSDSEDSSELNMKTSMVIFKRWISKTVQLEMTSPTCNQPVLGVTQHFIVRNSGVKHAWSISSVIMRSEI